MKPKLDYLHREVQRAAAGRSTGGKPSAWAGWRCFAAACGRVRRRRNPAPSAAHFEQLGGNALAGKPLENHLEIYNWSEYDDPSTFTKFTKLPAEAKAGMTVHETFYSSNDELLAKLHAGGTSYDIIVPSQNAVAELIQENSLMALDKALLPNLKYLDPSFLKPSYDPTGDYHVIKDFGITMFFYNNKIVTEEPKTMHDFYMALPKYVSKGRTNLLDGAEEVVPLALMALGLDPNTTSQSDFNQVKSFLLSDPQGRHHHRLLRLHRRRHRRQDHPQPGLERRRTPDRAGAREAGRHHRGHPARGVGDLGGQLVHPGDRAASGGRARLDQLAAHPEHRRDRDELPQLQDPDGERAGPAARGLRDDPMFNVPKTYTDNYHYILNVSPQVVEARTQIYSEFKAA